MGMTRPDDATPLKDGQQPTQLDQEQNMESEGQPVAPSPRVSPVAADAFRKLEDQAASERGDAAIDSDNER